MSTKFYQACFTRVDTGNLSAGWQVVNASADIMQSMVSFFENNEKANDVSVNKQNADGSPLRVTKIICDAKNIGLTQVQYGLSDSSGRARFFSHGYIASDPYEVLKKPEDILYLSDENFRFSVEETQNMPGELSYVRPLSEEEIMDKYGLSREACVRLIRCALFPLFSSTQTTVYVKTDGSREMAMELLYLVYRALPYSLRPRVTASTYAKPAGANSMYVFTDDIPAVGNRVDPLTGENNILGEAYGKRLERFPFATYYAEHMPQTTENHNRYYAALEDVLRDMGDIHTSRVESLRLAYMTLTSAETADSEIGGLLYDWLSLSVPANEKVTRRIEKFVRAAAAKGIALSENVIRLLQERVRESSSETLYDAYVQYEAQAHIRAGREAFGKLDEQRRDHAFYQALCAALRQSPEGEEFLNAYFLAGAKQRVALRSCSYSDMVGFVSECQYIRDIQKVRDIFCDKCRQILLTEQRKGKNFKAIYASYRDAVKAIDPGVTIAWTPITDDYDALFRGNFDVNRLAEYEEFYSFYNKQYPWSADFLTVRRAVGKREFNAAAYYIQKNCCLGNYRLDAEDVQGFAENLLEYALENDAAELCRDMRFWRAFAEVLHFDLVEFLAKKRVSVLCDPEVLDEAIDADGFWWEPENLACVYEGCKRYCDANREQDSITKTTMRLLKDQMADVKKSRKEEEKKKNEGHSGGTNPFLGVIQGLRNIGRHPEQERAETDRLPGKPGQEKRPDTDNKKRK